MADAQDRPVIEVRYKGLLTVTVMAAMVLQILDTTIANVALPHMQASLGATQESVTWILTSYILASAVALPLTGWLSARINPRRLFLASVAIFVGASMLCGMAINLETMVLFRVIQGVGGAFLGPLSQTILLDINKPSQHPRAMAVYGMGVMVGPIAGPVLGGWLTDNFNWRWVFFVNVPIGALCLFGLWMLLPKVPTKRRSIDLAGWAMIALSLAALQLMLDRGTHVDWFSSTEIWIELGVAVGAMWMFCVQMATARRPLFSRTLLRDRNLVTGCIFMFVMGLVTYAGMALLPGLLQGVLGYPVIDAGMLLASRGAGVLLMMPLAGRLAGSVDPRLIVGAGFSIAACSLWMMTGWSLDMDWHPIVISGFVQGLGIGLVFVPLNVLAFGTLDPALRTDGATLFNLCRNVGSSIGIAVVTGLLARNVQVSHADLAGVVTPYNLPVDPSLSAAFGSAGQAGMAMLDGMVNRQAAMIAYLDDFYLMSIATLITLPMLLLIRKPKGKGQSPIITE